MIGMEHSATCRCGRKYNCDCDSDESHYINFCLVCYSLVKRKKGPVLYGGAGNIFSIDLARGNAAGIGIIEIATPNTWPIVVPEEERKKERDRRG